MLPNHNKVAALDDLHSHLAPEQFIYLLTILSASATEIQLEKEHDSDISVSSSTFQTGLSLKSSSSDSEMLVSSEMKQYTSMIHDTDGTTTNSYTLSRILPKNQNFDRNIIEPSKLSIPADKSKLTVSRPKQILTQLPIRMNSFGSSEKSYVFDAARNRQYSSAQESILAIKGASSVGKEEYLNDVTREIAKNYSKVSLPLVNFQKHTVQQNDLTGGGHSSCTDLVMCKKILRKFNLKKMSLSSSTESVYAESLPDPDNPLVDIAGKIANEPVNPFPILRQSSNEITSGAARKPPNYFDISRIENEIDRDLRKLRDYSDVSQFFSKNPYGGSDSSKKSAGARSKPINLTRRQTNPLYKDFDPRGYQKSEDELALECIQMICNDFNTWIRSLSNNGSKRHSEDGSLEASQDPEDSIEIGPEFLVKILRNDLEFPEEDYDVEMGCKK